MVRRAGRLVTLVPLEIYIEINSLYLPQKNEPPLVQAHVFSRLTEVNVRSCLVQKTVSCDLWRLSFIVF